MKTYKKCLLFIVVTTLNDITKHSLKLANVFYKSLSHLKSMPHFILMLPIIWIH